MGSEWTTLILGNVCSKIGSGATPRGGQSVYLDQGDVTLIRSQNIYNGGFNHSGLTYITEEHAEQLNNVAVERDDVLLNITGDSVARCCQVDNSILPARVNQHVAIIRPDSNVLDARYLRFYLVSPLMQSKMLSWAGSGGTRNALTKGMIESFEIAAPPIDEQRAIAAVLGALDDKIELNRRMNGTLEATARALFRSWFVDFDPVRAKMDGRPTGLPAELSALFPGGMETDGVERPLGWGVGRLNEILELAYGKALKETNRRPGDIPVFGSNGQVGWHDERLVEGPGIIVGRKGNPGIVTWSQTDFFPIDTTFYVVSKIDVPALHYLYYALQIHDLASLSADSAVPGLNRNMAYGNIQVVPPDNLIIAFEEYCSTLFERIEMCAKESRTLAALRDALLPKLMSGEVRVDTAHLSGMV